MKKLVVLLFLLMANQQIGFAQKGKFHLGAEGGFSVPMGDYAREYMSLTGYSSNFSFGYYATDNMKFGLHLGIYSHPFDGRGTALETLKNASPSMFGEEPIKVTVSDYSSYQNVLLGISYIYDIKIAQKFSLDLKVALGANFFSDRGAMLTTFFDDAPYFQNMREEVKIGMGSCTSLYTNAGLGFRYLSSERISFGLSLDFGSTRLNYSQRFTFESKDDLFTYDQSSGTISNVYNAAWFNVNGGVYFTLGKGR